MASLLTALLDSSTAEPLDFPQLPPAPPFPCPFLTDEEIATYLPLLYARGWTVHPSDPKHAKKPAPELVKRFVFSTLDALEAFVQLDLLDITQSENVRDSNLPPHMVSLRAYSGDDAASRLAGHNAGSSLDGRQGAHPFGAASSAARRGASARSRAAGHHTSRRPLCVPARTTAGGARRNG